MFVVYPYLIIKLSSLKRWKGLFFCLSCIGKRGERAQVKFSYSLTKEKRVILGEEKTASTIEFLQYSKNTTQRELQKPYFMTILLKTKILKILL